MASNSSPEQSQACDAPASVPLSSTNSGASQTAADDMGSTLGIVTTDSNPPTQSQDTSPSASLPLFRLPQSSKAAMPKTALTNAETEMLLSAEAAIDQDPTKGTEDSATREVIKTLLADEHGLRTSRKPSDVKPSVEVALSVKKPRKAPAKRVTTKSKPKKRVTDTVSRSNTPSSRAPKSIMKRTSSGTPMSASPAPVGEDDDVMSLDDEEDDEEVEGDFDDDDQLYCICRRGDDHTPMIACDGGCNDWFHGRCVSIKEADSNLIDRYICPNCEKKGVGVTTWKPMCRRYGCRKPARVLQARPSKYCSDECGIDFMSEQIRLSNKRHKTYKAQHPNQVTDPHTDHLAGAPLNPLTIMSLVKNTSNAQQFRALGEAIGNGTMPAGNILTLSEKQELVQLAAAKEDLRIKKAQLKDREVLFGLVRDRATAFNKSAGKGSAICGYDERLGFSDKEIAIWKNSPGGKYAFEQNSLEPPPVTNGHSADGSTDAKSKTDVEMAEAGAAPTTDGETEPADANQKGQPIQSYSMCLVKRCREHVNWTVQKNSEIRFEGSHLGEKMREVDRRELEIQETALLRWKEREFGNLPPQEEDQVMEEPKVEPKVEPKEEPKDTMEPKKEDDVIVKMEVDETDQDTLIASQLIT